MVSDSSSVHSDFLRSKSNFCEVLINFGDKGSEIFFVHSEGLHDMRNPEALSTLGRGHAYVLSHDSQIKIIRLRVSQTCLPSRGYVRDRFLTNPGPGCCLISGHTSKVRLDDCSLQ
jgi:hypothetical protein